METLLSFLLFGGTIIVAFAALLAVNPRHTTRMTEIVAVCSGAMGMILYGYGFLSIGDNVPVAIARTLFSVCCMFIGNVDFESISSADLFRQLWVVVLFWIVHLMALYATATAAISAIGAEALRNLRVRLAGWHELDLIYGVNSDSLDFARALSESPTGVCVFVDDAPELAEGGAVSSTGAILRSDSHALSCDNRFMKSMGIRGGKRKITLYALKKDTAQNLSYAKRFLDALQARGISPERTQLVILARESSNASALQVSESGYGYGFVTVFQQSTIAARLLTQLFPPCNSISFDENCQATDNFEAVVIGFGQLGQAVLKSLIMNGQFQGSTFHAAVFSPDCQTVNGFFSNSLTQVLSRYNITFHPYDARSKQMYRYLTENGKKIRYVAVCTGSVKLNQEIAEELIEFFRDMDIPLPVYQCSYKGVKTFDPDMGIAHTYPLYHPNVLSMRTLDSLAMVVNHYYRGQICASPLASWMKCDYFSRISSRAAADFLPATLRAAGKTREQVLAGDWSLSEVQLDTLSRTEHLRWCAFHYCMGYSPMSPEEFRDRSAEYLRRKALDPDTGYRIVKNVHDKTHACLVDWEDLDELRDREMAVTGKDPDYKASDRNNILIVPELLLIQSQQKA